ncbi:Ppx/GppA phosphatase family-domain-containing protein [Lineolata rhizophorae]|uniref:Ppx/GppA phosphatase family-domain-containing protein n=1 Tax=Lineolata rhizophorae TaxID=578093 RepID=A0A6A6P0E9_9PEZI|nr:Ppx/GppA phosphatase family-domain-containing protein [Lineolata rhizophorae]
MNSSQDYHALVDMGSNGIRFSITDLSPPKSRILPTVYTDRADISLYDAQWSAGEKRPIPRTTIDRVIASLRRFRLICEDMHVPGSQIRILATEATRQALNSEEFRAEIRAAIGIEVEMLPKQEEGRVGAFGVASSLSAVNGLVMDLGGGSTQLTWLLSTSGGEIQMSAKGSISLPYGAAALSRRLQEASSQKEKDVLQKEITTALRDAVSELDFPEVLKSAIDNSKGLSLYLSGGGFRGWGFVLMSQHPVSPYPIPLINGFSVPVSEFHDTDAVKSAINARAVASPDMAGRGSEGIFRVSERRASQVPAVALLVSCLADALPAIDEVHFCQGGVREGWHFSRMPSATRVQHPLVVGTQQYAPTSTEKFLLLLKASIPGPSSLPPLFAGAHMLRAVAQSLFAHAHLARDLRAAAGIRSTTTGELASVHGAGHVDRAVLAYVLCERWGGLRALSPGDQSFHGRIEEFLRREGAGVTWWCRYLGRVASVIGGVYPGGVIPDREELERMQISADWADADSSVGSSLSSLLGSKGKDKDKKHKKKADSGSRFVKLTVRFPKNDAGRIWAEGSLKGLKAVEKVGKKKHWTPGEKGAKVVIELEGIDLQTEDEQD